MNPISAPPGADAAKPKIPDHELIKCVGQGSYGQVWLARTLTKSWRAVKFVWPHPDEDQSFNREYEGLLKYEPLSRTDPSHVAIYHVGRHPQGDYFFYLMELADDLGGEGGVKPESYLPATLRNRLRQSRRLPLGECLCIGIALAQALDNLHRHHLVHRDIKPSNIIFVKGQAKLADIGLVTRADTSNSFVGTEGYVAPEGPGSASADLYSLGKVLYEISTGQDRKDFPELPADLPDRPDRIQFLELNAIITRLCERSPRRRYPSARQLHADLLSLASGESIRKRKALQQRVVAGGMTAAALMAACVGLLTWTSPLLHEANFPDSYTSNAPAPAFLHQWGTEGQGQGEFRLPQGIAVDSRGNVYVVDELNNRIQKFTQEGRYLSEWGTPRPADGQLVSPSAIAVDSNDNIYVCESGSHRISVFTSQGEFLRKWGHYGVREGELMNPWGIALDSGGNVYVSEHSNHRISKFNRNGQFVSVWGSFGHVEGQLDAPGNLAIDASDILYVADFGNDRIVKYTTEGTFLGAFGTRGNGGGYLRDPAGIAVDTQGQAVYVSEQAGHRILKFTLEGNPLTKWGLPGKGAGRFSGPAGIAVNSTRQWVYVADGNHGIQVFSFADQHQPLARLPNP